MHVLSTELINKVDCYLDENHETFSAMGQRFFDQFGSDREKISSQVRNLQQISCSAPRFADIEDFVKNQMGKGDKNSKKWKAVGDRVLTQLTSLREYSKKVTNDERDRMALRLHLARGWVQAVVSEYLYQRALREMEQGR